MDKLCKKDKFIIRRSKFYEICVQDNDNNINTI